MRQHCGICLFRQDAPVSPNFQFPGPQIYHVYLFWRIEDMTERRENCTDITSSQKVHETCAVESILTVAPDLSAVLMQYPSLLWYPHMISHASSSDPTSPESQDNWLASCNLLRHAWKAILHFWIQLLNSHFMFGGVGALPRCCSPWEQLILTHFSCRAPIPQNHWHGI